MKQTFSLCFLLSIIHGSTIRPLCQPHQYLILKQCLSYGYGPGILHSPPPLRHTLPSPKKPRYAPDSEYHTFCEEESRVRPLALGKPQTANRSVQLRVCSFALPRFQILATRSVQFSSFLFRQNIIQYKNAYRNCKVAREPRRN